MPSTIEEDGYKPNVRHIIFTPFISEVAGYILYGIYQAHCSIWVMCLKMLNNLIGGMNYYKRKQKNVYSKVFRISKLLMQSWLQN